MKNRSFIWISVLIAVVLGMGTLSSCSKKEDSAKSQRIFKVWHYESENGAMGSAWKLAMEKFQEMHPDVTLVYENKGFEQIRQTAQMVLNSEDAPDVMEYNKGNATAGLLSKQGLLADLSSEAKDRGWDTILSPSLQTTCRYSPDGVMGSGNWYGVTNYGEYVMVYYNKDMFDEHGMTIPKTLAEFEQIMETFADAGITPLSVAGAEYPAQQVYYELVLSAADRELVDAYQLYTSDVDFNESAFAFGAKKMLEWVDKGFIGQDAVGMKAENMGVAFTNGNYPIMISGSWWYGRFMNEIKEFEWGVFPFPGNALHPGSSGNIWVIAANTKNKDLACDFIDITLSPEVQNLMGNAGGIPVNADVTSLSDPKIQELIAGFNTINENDGLAFYPDWPAAGFYDVLVSNVQELMGKTKTVDQFLDSISREYYANK